jgi:hypothetical protein
MTRVRALLGTLALTLIAFTAGVGCGDDGSDDGEPQETGNAAYMESCADEGCQEGLVCFNFNAKGKICTDTCAGDDACEAPSTGCNNMGVCKAP